MKSVVSSTIWKSEALHPDNVNRRLAKYIDQQRQIIIQEWMQRAGRDGKSSSETPSSKEMHAHLARLFDDIIATLRYSEDETYAHLANQYVSDHTSDRWIGNFALPDILGEIAHLRTAFLHRLMHFEEINRDFGISARLFALTTIHRSLDELGIRAAQFHEKNAVEAQSNTVAASASSRIP